MTGLILNLNLAARNVLAADIVDPESGNDSIWLVLVPCTIVKIILGVADDNMFTFPVWWIADMISCGLVSFVNVFLFVRCVTEFGWSGSPFGVEEEMVVFVFLNCEINIVVLSINIVVLFLNSLIFVCNFSISCICKLFKCCFLGAWSE